MRDRSSYPVRKVRLEDEGQSAEVRCLPPEEKLAMVWQITLQTWMLRGELRDEPRLLRHAVRTLRERG